MHEKILLALMLEQVLLVIHNRTIFLLQFPQTCEFLSVFGFFKVMRK
jgi:hypothetical protein